MPDASGGGFDSRRLQSSAESEVMEPTFWRKNGWTAWVIMNEEDDGWAVEIRNQGIAEPVLISPWVMGRDKKNPKPFDAPAFATFVKTASEVLGRSARQRDQAMTRKALHRLGGPLVRGPARVRGR